MSAYIDIPARGSKPGQQQLDDQPLAGAMLGHRQPANLSSPSSSSSSSMASSLASSPHTPLASLRRGLPATAPSSSSQPYPRSSFLSSSIAKQEHTVIDVGHPDGPPRLITCVKASQGFDWNQEIFLPSHFDHDFSLETKKDPVHEIRLTDSEIAALFPQ